MSQQTAVGSVASEQLNWWLSARRQRPVCLAANLEQVARQTGGNHEIVNLYAPSVTYVARLEDGPTG